MAVSPATGRNDLNKRCIKKDWDEVVRLLLRAAEASMSMQTKLARRKELSMSNDKCKRDK